MKVSAVGQCPIDPLVLSRFYRFDRYRCPNLLPVTLGLRKQEDLNVLPEKALSRWVWMHSYYERSRPCKRYNPSTGL